MVFLIIEDSLSHETHGPLKRQGSMDALRGMAALQVMGTHYISAFYPYAVFGAQGSYVKKSSWETLLFFPPFGLLTAGNFAICLFFILSGYVLSYRFLGERHAFLDIASAMLKRPIRLGGLVVFTVILSAALWAGGFYFNSEVSALTGARPWFERPWRGDLEFGGLLVNMGTAMFAQAGYYNPPLWTIKIELYGSMYVFIFLMIFGACRRRGLIVLALLLMLRNSPYFGFFMGLFLADMVKHHAANIQDGRRKAMFLIALIGAAYFSSYPGYVSPAFLRMTAYGVLPERSAMFVGYPMLAAILVFGLLALSRTCQQALTRPSMLWLGQVSYAVYALHFLVLGSLASWLFLAWRPMLGHDLAFLAVVVCSLPLTLWLSHWATMLVDMPSARLGQWLSRRAMGLIRVGAM
jgi:peptidoglycan/LPS O-acetylase OafA/YrhL